MADTTLLFATEPTASRADAPTAGPASNVPSGLAGLCLQLPVPLLVVDASDRVALANAALLQLLDLPPDTDLRGAAAAIGALRETGLETLELAAEGRTWRVLWAAPPVTPERRTGLEATFLHDLLNTAVGVQGLTRVLTEAEAWELPRITTALHGMAGQLVTQIRGLRDLLAAEDGDLHLQPRVMSVAEALLTVASRYENHPVARDRRIVVNPCEGQLTTDPVVLGRILDNLVKNALEATPTGDRVTLEARCECTDVTFTVHNPAEIPAAVQPRIFERAFSTRGKGRGMGTYSVKLLVETYLRGRVAFTSDAARGTTFIVSLPADGT